LSIGGFDTDTLGREVSRLCQFCQRAFRAGWKEACPGFTAECAGGLTRRAPCSGDIIRFRVRSGAL